MGDFHDARFEKLDAVTGAWLGHEAGGVAHTGNIDFTLPYAHGFDNYNIERGEHGQAHRPDLGAQAAMLAATRQRADKNAIVIDAGFHAQPISQQCTAADRAGGIDRQHPDPATPTSPHRDQSGGQ